MDEPSGPLWYAMLVSLVVVTQAAPWIYFYWLDEQPQGVSSLHASEKRLTVVSKLITRRKGSL